MVEDCRINLCDSEYGRGADEVEFTAFMISRNVLST